MQCDNMKFLRAWYTYQGESMLCVFINFCFVLQSGKKDDILAENLAFIYTNLYELFLIRELGRNMEERYYRWHGKLYMNTFKFTY